MKWEKQDKIQVAQGKFGKFVIQKSGVYYVAKYYSRERTFTFPYRRSIKRLKELCKDNWYWED